MPDTAEHPTLTLAEMEQQYHGEWVVVIDPVTDDHLEVLSGTVIAHSPDRAEMHRQVRAYRAVHHYTHSASLCFLPVDEDLGFWITPFIASTLA